eukprot:3327484-Pyramimonas_sp.AAC.1
MRLTAQAQSTCTRRETARPIYVLARCHAAKSVYILQQTVHFSLQFVKIGGKSTRVQKCARGILGRFAA